MHEPFELTDSILSLWFQSMKKAQDKASQSLTCAMIRTVFLPLHHMQMVFKFADFTEDCFPHGDVLCKCITDHALNYDLKMASSTNVASIKQEPNPGH